MQKYASRFVYKGDEVPPTLILSFRREQFNLTTTLLYFVFLFKMRFTQIIAAAVLAAPLALAIPVAAPAPPATADLNYDLTANPHYATALLQVKERYPNLAEEDATTAALGYLEAAGAHVAGGFSNSTALVWFTCLEHWKQTPH